MKVYVYVMPVEQESYPAGLARAIHFACETQDGTRIGLNRDYGILFAQGVIREDNVIVPMGVQEPGIFRMSDGWIGICGKRVLENGDADSQSAGKVLFWMTRDLIHFEEKGLAPLEEIMKYCPADHLDVPEAVAQEAITYWGRIHATMVMLEVKGVLKSQGTSQAEGVLKSQGTSQAEGASESNGEAPADDVIEIASMEELDDVRAAVFYSDGSKTYKNIAWDKSGMDIEKSGVHEVSGRIERPFFPFPLAKGYGDPVIFPWEGKWYYVSTNDNLNDVGIYVREASDVSGLFDESIQERLILPYDPERGLEQTFWAPEFHVIGGELYLLFAVSGHSWGPQCHMMKLKKGGRIIDADAWEDPVRVLRKDGSPLAQGPITLDMTYLKTKTGSYVLWSYREGIGTPLDSGSMIFIATTDERRPWMLTSDPVLLTRPLYGWENVAGTINNEGPYAFQKDGRVYVTYSGGSANGYTYALGLLTADEDADLLQPSSWKKSGTPVLTFRSVDHEYGPGHNSFFTLGEDLMIAYHAETGLHESLRCDGIRRVHFRKDGTPYFQMSAQEDLPDEKMQITVKIKKRPKRRIRLWVSYDGTNYHGWQIQSNGITIESELNRALTELHGQEIHVIGASRTDAGVHALGNVAVYDVDSPIPAQKVRYAINARLPEDIRVMQSEEVPADWHPRKCASRKTYEYRIYLGEILPPVKRLYCHHVYRPLDVEAMRRAAAFLVGEYDFKSFCQENAQVESTVRTIYSIQIINLPQTCQQTWPGDPNPNTCQQTWPLDQNLAELAIRVTGNGFLYNMVRIIVGTLLEVGYGRWEPEKVAEILEKKDRSAAGPTAPAKGLTLLKYEFLEEN